ncbi:putative uncharacterized protein DDB_G0286901 [Topomyia yanbarensis]|uniref:putative uncharacterized protein DDB_G0286901 n=1 Tax=Topomyia yanbarensis TaxID=2498891 RepID=UPI00273B4CB5|nr:putative uncharacterized protein DDB_G0286901 [Topomyia yanbarensis]
MDDELLIEEVKKHPELYNLTNKHYMNSKRKNEIWQEIGSILNADGTTCKTRWNNIRDVFRRSSKNEATRSGQGAKCIKRYKYSRQLEFLKPSLEERNTICSVNPEPTLVELESTGSGSIKDALPAKTDPPKRRKRDAQFSERHRTTVSKPSEILMDYIVNKKEAHHIDAFLAGCAVSLKALNPLLQAKAKAEIFAVVNKYELINIEEMDNKRNVEDSLEHNSSHLNNDLEPLDSTTTIHSTNSHIHTNMNREDNNNTNIALDNINIFSHSDNNNSTNRNYSSISSDSTTTILCTNSNINTNINREDNNNTNIHLDNITSSHSNNNNSTHRNYSSISSDSTTTIHSTNRDINTNINREDSNNTNILVHNINISSHRNNNNSTNYSDISSDSTTTIHSINSDINNIDNNNNSNINSVNNGADHMNTNSQNNYENDIINCNTNGSNINNSNINSTTNNISTDWFPYTNEQVTNFNYDHLIYGSSLSTFFSTFTTSP